MASDRAFSTILFMMVMMWSIVLLYLSLIPSPPQIEGPFGWDKLQHAAALGVMALMVSWACIAAQKTLIRSVCIGFVYATLFGGVIEVLQEFFTTSRQADPLDFAADALGALIAVIVLYHFLLRRGLH